MCGKVGIAFRNQNDLSTSAFSRYSRLLAASAAFSFRQQPHSRPHKVRSLIDIQRRQAILIHEAYSDIEPISRRPFRTFQSPQDIVTTAQLPSKPTLLLVPSLGWGRQCYHVVFSSESRKTPSQSFRATRTPWYF